MRQDLEEVEISFDKGTTELDALQRTVYALDDLMTVDIRESGTDYVCTLFPRRSGLDKDTLKHRIRAELVDQTLRLRIAKETEPIRNLIFALAFSETGVADGEEPSE
jgi:His-Xaa-Ser system protein HxsD